MFKLGSRSVNIEQQNGGVTLFADIFFGGRGGGVDGWGNFHSVVPLIKSLILNACAALSSPILVCTWTTCLSRLNSTCAS